MNKIKVVLTDLGNVVVVANHVVTHAYLAERGIPYKRARNFFLIDEYRDFARGEISERTFSSAVKAELGVAWPNWMVRRAHDAHMYAVDEDVCDLIESVNVPIAVATDTNVWQTHRVEQELLLGRRIIAGKVFRSNEIGQLKSDYGTFTKYAESLGEEPANILFIDDRLDLCLEAKRAGFLVCQFVDIDQLQGALASLGLI